jgi:hypothetical protein
MAFGREQDIQLLTAILNQLTTLNTNLEVANAKYPTAYDYFAVTTRDGSNNPTTIVFKTGGASGTTVFTHTITYTVGGDVDTFTVS